MAEQPISVMIVDDDFYARESLRFYLSRDKRTRVVATASAPGEAVEVIEKMDVRAHPRVVLLDVRFGDDDEAGIKAIGVLLQAAPDSKILMSSIERVKAKVIKAIATGASGYVWKNESAERIANAVVSVAQGRFVVTRTVAECLIGSPVEVSADETQIMQEHDTFRDLTPAVRSALYLFCFCGMSKEEIAEELGVSTDTVASRIKIAYQFLHAGNRAEAFQALVQREKTNIHP